MLTKLVADGGLIAVLLIAIPVIMMNIRKKFWHKAPVLIMAGLTSLLVGKLMSVVYQPELVRPFEKLGVDAGAAYIDNPGFPSDHALLATVVVLAVWVLTKYSLVRWVLVALVVAMSIGRVSALVHTPMDVIFGILAGLSGGIWYKKLTK